MDTNYPVPESNQVQQAREGLAVEAKKTVQQIKELAFKALELEQAALFDEPEFEEALLLPRDELHKRYTGKNAENIEWRRNTAAYMMQIGCPKNHICKLLHMNSRLVDALAVQCARAVAGFTEEFALDLLKQSAGMFAVADLKKDQANTLQAATAGGILADKAIAIKMLGLGGMDPNAGAIDVQQEDPAREAFVERLKQLAAKPKNEKVSA